MDTYTHSDDGKLCHSCTKKNTIYISYNNIAITGHSLNSVNVFKNTSMESLGLVCSIHNGIIPVANMWDRTFLSYAWNNCNSGKLFNMIIFHPKRGDRQVIPTYSVTNASLVYTGKHAILALPAQRETLQPSPGAVLPHSDQGHDSI